METRRVYRVEHADRDYGPFTGEGTWQMHDVLHQAGLAPHYDETDDAFHSEAHGFPGPRNDARLQRRWGRGELDDRCFGCASERDLAKWFPLPLAEYLDREGYEVTVWDVPRKAVAYGQRQVAFDKALATYVGSHPVSQLHAAKE